MHLNFIDFTVCKIQVNKNYPEIRICLMSSAIWDISLKYFEKD